MNPGLIKFSVHFLLLYYGKKAKKRKSSYIRKQIYMSQPVIQKIYLLMKIKDNISCF